jgi:hypothetical protein
VLASAPHKLDQLRALNPPPAGSSHTLLARAGGELFKSSQLEGVTMISLDPHLGDSAAASRFTALPEAYFPPLCHMSEALRVESSLGRAAALCAAAEDGAPPTDEAAHAAAALFSQHVFFCFNAAPDGAVGSVIPVTAKSAHGAGGALESWMLLYTCEMVLEHARPHMEALGAFAGHAQRMAATAVPASAVLASLKDANAGNAGVHVNEFVPGLAPQFKALGLTTAGISALFEAAGVI